MKNEAGLKLTGIRVLVRLQEVEEKTAGGIVLAKATVDKEEKAQTSSILVDASDDARLCKEMKGVVNGDLLFFARYAGAGCEFTKKGVKYRVMNATDILGVLEEPLDDAFKAAASTAETFPTIKDGSEVRYAA